MITLFNKKILFFTVIFGLYLFIFLIKAYSQKSAHYFYPVLKSKEQIKIDGNLKDWNLKRKIKLNKKYLEIGQISDEADLNGDLYFLWDQDYLYLAAVISDNEIIADMKEKNIWRNDCLEIFIDPENNGFFWQNKSDYQFGFSPSEREENNEVKIWEWFHADLHKKVKAKSITEEDEEYIIEAAIPWDIINIKPKRKMKFGLCIGLNDIDLENDETPKAKILWPFCKIRSGIKLASFVLR